jgi:hypothetical protein
MVTSANSIWVVTEEPEDDLSKSLLPSVGRRVIAKSFEISNDVLALHLEAFFKSFQMVLGRLPSSIDHFTVDEIQLNLVINANGGVELIGKGEAGLSTGLTFTLRRQTSKEV